MCVFIDILLFRKSDADFELQRYKHLINCLQSILSEQYNMIKYSIDPTEDNNQGIYTYFQDDKQFLDIFIKAETIHKQLCDFENRYDESSKTKIKILISELSLMTSLIFIRIMAEISAIDHVEKYRLKVQYIEEDVKMFDKLLSVYYVHGVISGTISESRNIDMPSQVTLDSYKEGTENRDKLKKVHPYCKVLMELKEKTALRVQKYASGNTFRPKEPSYGSFVKVIL